MSGGHERWCRGAASWAGGLEIAVGILVVRVVEIPLATIARGDGIVDLAFAGAQGFGPRA